jgi:predicted amidophosphoribosyltransferase
VLIESIKSLVFPTSCLVCKKYGAKLCPLCKEPWQKLITKVWFSDIPLYYQANYDQITMPIFLAAKENNDRFAQELLANAIVDAISAAKLKFSNQKLYLVPIPSRATNVRKRGYSHLQKILKTVATLLNNVEVVSLLRIRKRISDQTNLDAQTRYQNLHNAYRCDLKFKKFLFSRINYSQSEVLVIDDLITTGASVSEAIRALNAEKIKVSAVICAAATLGNDRLTYEPRNTRKTS